MPYDDEEEEGDFDYTMVIVMSKDNFFYRAKYAYEIKQEITHIPVDDLFILKEVWLDELEFDIPTTPRLTVCPDYLLEAAFVKKPNLMWLLKDHYPETAYEMFIHEATIGEILRRNPHPLVTEYYGIVIERGKLVGLAWKHYGIFFGAYLDSYTTSPRQCSLTQLQNDLYDAVSHLHSLGYTHKDIKPDNLVFDDENNRLVLIDFDSAAPLGGLLGLKQGTPGYVDMEQRVSQEGNDWFAVENVEADMEMVVLGPVEWGMLLLVRMRMRGVSRFCVLILGRKFTCRLDRDHSVDDINIVISCQRS